MRKSMTMLSAAVAAAKARSEDGVAWLTPRGATRAAPLQRNQTRGASRHRLALNAVRESAGETVVWLASRPAGVARAPSRRLAQAGRITAVLGAGCFLSGLAPDVARAPIGTAYAAVDRIIIDPGHLPPSLSPVEIEPFAGMALRRLQSEPETAAEPPAEETRPDDTLRFGPREIPRRLVETILKAALATDVDPVYLMALADKESSFVPSVRASTSSAEGLFQFIDSTWLETVRAFGAQHGLAAAADSIEIIDGRATIADAAARARVLRLRRDPYIAAVMAAEMLKRDRADIALKVGRDLTRTELYLAHFLGPQDAARFIEMRDRSHRRNAAKAFRAAANANRAIFFARKGRRSHGLALGEVYGRLDQMIDSRAARFQNVMAFAGDTRI